MWQFDPSLNQWRVHEGDISNSASFTSNCIFSATNHPSNNDEPRTSWKDACNHFYGIVEGAGGSVFCFAPAINQYSLTEGTNATWGTGIILPTFGT